MSGLFSNMIDIEPYLRQKYELMDQEAKAQTTQARASMQAANTAAEFNPARIGLAQSQAAGLDMGTALMPQESRVSNLLKGAQTVQSLSQANLIDRTDLNVGRDFADSVLSKTSLRSSPRSRPAPSDDILGYLSQFRLRDFSQ